LHQVDATAVTESLIKTKSWSFRISRKEAHFNCWKTLTAHSKYKQQSWYFRTSKQALRTLLGEKAHILVARANLHLPRSLLARPDFD